MRKLNEIIVHCTATRPEWMVSRPLSDKVTEVKRWHVQDNGWADIGYHYLVDRGGAIATGRPLGKVGAHVRGRNTGSIGIALIGGQASRVSSGGLKGTLKIHFGGGSAPGLGRLGNHLI